MDGQTEKTSCAKISSKSTPKIHKKLEDKYSSEI